MPSKTLFEDIKDFHVKFGLDYDGPPRRLADDLEHFRALFMGEELAEYITEREDYQKMLTGLIAYLMRRSGCPSLEKQFDALIDLVYVALGTAYLHGFDFDAGWARVHEANMRKVRALKESDSLRGSTNDVVKPAGWIPPDLSDLVLVDRIKL